MTDRAAQARKELAAWIKKYKPTVDIELVYYDGDHGDSNISVDDTIIARVNICDIRTLD